MTAGRPLAPGGAARPSGAAGAAGTAAIIGGRRLARNAAQNLLTQGLPLLVAVVAVPPVVHGLGAARFGILSLVWILTTYFAELGFGRATTRYASLALVRGDERLLADAVWWTLAIQVAIGAAAGAAIALASPLLGARVLSVPADLQAETVAVLLFLAAFLPVITIGSTFRGVLEAAQRFDLINAVRLPASVGTFLVPLAGVVMGWGLPRIVALLLLLRVATVAAFLALAARRFPAVMRRPRWNPELIRGMAGYGGWVTVSSVLAPVLVYLDRFVLAAAAGVDAVGYYAAPFELVVRLWLIPGSLIATLFPAINALSERADWDRVERLLVRSLKFLLLVLGPIAVCLVLGAGDLLMVWLGPEFAERSALALRLLAIAVLVNSLAQIPHTILQAVGRADLTTRLQIAEIPVFAVIAWVFIHRWGIPGAAAAWLVRVTLDAALLFLAIRWTTALSLRSLVRGGVPVGAAVLGGVGLLVAGILPAVAGGGARLAALVVSGLLASLLLARTALDSDERRALRDWLRLRHAE